MLEFEVNDMTCNHCVASITKAISALAPDVAVQADLDTLRVTVSGDIDQDAVLVALGDIGFTAKPVPG